MPRLPALRRCSAVLGLSLVMGSLASCGQVGKLFLRMPDVEFPPLAPLVVGEPRRIFLPEGVTLPAPVSATRPAPAAFTRAAPAATTRIAPASTSHAAPAAATAKAPAAATHP